MSDVDEDVAQVLDQDDERGSWRREVKRLREEARARDQELANARLELQRLAEENRQLRGLLQQVAATAMSGAKA